MTGSTLYFICGVFYPHCSKSRSSSSLPVLRRIWDQFDKARLIHTSWVQGPHTDPLSCHLSGQWQLMQVMNNLAQTHSAIHRWCITELCTWNLRVFINQRHPNTFIKRKTEPAVSLVHTPFPWNKCAIILDWCRKKIHFLSLWLSAGICYFDHVKYMNSPSKVHDPQRAALISTI